ETVKGWGFPGAGTNAAHNLPLVGNPSQDAAARALFNEGAQRLFVPMAELREAREQLNRHARHNRPKERDHALARRAPEPVQQPELPLRTVGEKGSPMEGVDQYFCKLVAANP